MTNPKPSASTPSKKYLKFNGMIELDKEITDAQECQLMNDITELLDVYGENYLFVHLVNEEDLDNE
jgi:hypothetical protein